MKILTKRNPIIWMMFSVFLLAAFMMPTRAIVERRPLSFSAPSPAEDPERLSHPKMQSALNRLADIFLSSGSERAREYGLLRKMDIRGDSVRVVTTTNSGFYQPLDKKILSLMAQKIESLGGKIELTYRQWIQNYLPIPALETLAADPLVKYVRLPLKPFPTGYVSEGVAKTGANQWKNISPYRNEEEAKICILDIGFSGYLSLLGSELPGSVQARSFRSDNDIFADEVHGTANAEIVHDMAPNAKLWLVNFETDIEEHLAVDWIVSQGVQVISYSLGWFNAGAGDGTGPICDDVETAAANNVIWASSAGNDAQNHWEGTFSDPDGDGWHNFSGTDRYLEFHVPAYTPVGVYLNWNDWGVWTGNDYSGSNQDFDIYLYYWLGSSWMLVDKSINQQDGIQWPVEEISGYYSKSNATWAVSIRKYNAIKNVKLELFTYGNDTAIEYDVPSGSLVIPADAASALATGATDAIDDSLHYYSSWGPTHDGRIKPDLTGPSGVSTATYGTFGFYGTSAAAPHVAGACGLVKGNTPFPPAQIISILEKRAVDMGDPGKDNKYGYGRLNLKK